METQNGYKAAEASFLKAIRKDKSLIAKNKLKGYRINTKVKRALRQSTVEYFREILDDATETRLWMVFMTGKIPREGPDGKVVLDDFGNPVLDDVELNPISWKAFEKAVEYKRGRPIVTLRSEDDQGTDSKAIEINIIGATPEFFEEQAKARGFLTR
ncbi:hypothetical protein KGP36_03260 [Patescibacteria group bacterium]|nr:hypothetical protein [Patescibacteria group bacterium]